MDRFDQVEAFHNRLVGFCRSCTLSSTRIYALARFLIVLPTDEEDLACFREEVGDALLQDLRAEVPVRLEDDERRTIELALEGLRAEGRLEQDDLTSLLDALTAGALSAGAGVAGASLAAMGPDRPPSGAPTTAVTQVPVPLVCELPPVPGCTDTEYVGVLSIVTLSARVVDDAGNGLSWNNSNNQIGVNRLRLLGDTAADAHMTARETVYGLCQGGPPGGVLKGVTARALRRMDVDRLGFELSLPEKEMPIAGASISLALGVGMAGAMIGLLRDGRGLAPRRDLAWTGELTPAGQVNDVDSRSLRAKVRAARAAGLRGLVVSRTQGDLACQIAAEAAWDGQIYTTGSLREVFDHGELLESATVPDAVVAACRRPRLQQTAAYALLGLMGLILLLLSPRILDEVGVHWFPAWRPMPRMEELTVPRHINPGFDLAIPRMADFHYQPDGGRWSSFVLIVTEVGGFREAGPYLILGEGADESAGLDGRVRILHIPTRRWVGEYVPLSTWLPNDPLRETSANLYTVKAGMVADVDDDDYNEIILSIAFNPSPRTVLQILDEDLHCERSAEHLGHLEYLAARDLTGDGRPEVLASGYHDRTKGLSLLVLETEDFYPVRNIESLQPLSKYTSAGLTFDPERQPCLVHHVQPFRSWMGTFPEDPLMQIGWPMLALDSVVDTGSVVRTHAYLNSARSMIVSTTFGLPETVLNIVPSQIIVNRAELLQARGELDHASAEEWLEFIVTDLREAMRRTGYIQR